MKVMIMLLLLLLMMMMMMMMMMMAAAAAAVLMDLMYAVYCNIISRPLSTLLNPERKYE